MLHSNDGCTLTTTTGGLSQAQARNRQAAALLPVLSKVYRRGSGAVAQQAPNTLPTSGQRYCSCSSATSSGGACTHHRAARTTKSAKQSSAPQQKRCPARHPKHHTPVMCHLPSLQHVLLLGRTGALTLAGVGWGGRVARAQQRAQGGKTHQAHTPDTHTTLARSQPTTASLLLYTAGARARTAAAA